MIQVNQARCCYCGGCVPVCPVSTITLAETLLQIGRACIDCDLCLPACPVGALYREELVPPARLAPRQSYDLVVVGAGPAGSVAARIAAERGLRVLLVEKRQEIGSPVRCAEGVRHDALVSFVEPDPRWISATVDKERVIVVEGGRERDHLFADGNTHGYVIERRIFDRVLAEMAVEAGAQVMVKTTVTGLIREGGVIRGVVAESAGTRYEIEARVVIGADGVESQVARWANLPVLVRQRDSLVCAQYTLAGIEVDPTCCVYYLGDEVAPGGYAWIFPKGEGRANVGLGVQADRATEPALAYLNRWIEAHAFLAQGSPVSLIAGNVPTGVPPHRIVADGLMLAGDAAHQADPITAGGITNAMLAGRLAAEVAAEAIAAGDTSAGRLAAYQERWEVALGRKMARNYRLRQKYAGHLRTSEAFVRIFAIAAAGSK